MVQINPPLNTGIVQPQGDQNIQDAVDNNQPNLPNPADTLATSRARYPGVSDQVLMGRESLPRLSNTVENATTALMRRPVRDLGSAAVLHGSQENARLSLMPTKNVPGPDKLKNIENYIKEGKRIFDKAMGGTFQGVPGKQEISKLMWYLQAMGSAKCAESSGGQGTAMFKEGAFFIEDPQGNLQAFLERANTYNRASSHMKDYQALGDDFKAKGFDLRNVSTPNCRKTLLFQRLPRNTETGQSGLMGTGDKRMLFIKMEPSGCRGFSSKGSGTPRPEGQAPDKVKAFKRFFLNLKNSIGHLGGFIKSVGQRLGVLQIRGMNNRERIPDDIKDAWKDLSERVTRSGIGIANNLLTRLDRGNPLSDASGVKQMRANINEALTRFAALPQNQQDRYAGLNLAMNRVKQLIDARGDHQDMRIGNEIILTREETSGMDVVSVVRRFDVNQPVEASGVMSPKSMDVLVRGYQYILDNLDNVTEANALQTFTADSPRSNYQIGTGDELTLFSRRPATEVKDAVKTLTGNNARLTKAILSVAHQGLVMSLASEAYANAGAVHGVIPPANRTSATSISRLPNNEQGEQVYKITYKGEGIRGNATSTGGAQPKPVSLNEQQSIYELNMDLRLTVHADGSITPSLGDVPKYHYKLVPARDQQPGNQNQQPGNQNP